MKLFGDTGKHLHSQSRKTENPERPEKTARKKADPGALFHAPIWRKLRIPAIIFGAVVLLALLVVLAYSIWEKPPEQKPTAGPTIHTLQPGTETTGPAQGTALPVVIPVETDAQETPEETPAPSETPTAEPVKTGRRESCYTFVILAYDQSMANTDTILVGRLDTEAGTLDAVNIPRDTLVNVSWGVKKINTVLPLERNDTDRFLEHLGDLIGFTPDCYAVVNIRAVEKLVDCVGGVYYNVPRDMDYDDPSQDLQIHISAGYQLLNGENAVKVMRFRVGNNNTGYPNGDLGRIATQQDLLMSMAAQFLKLGNIPNLNTAIQIVQDNVNSNLTANNIAFFAREFLKLDKENIRFHTLPGKGVMIRGGSYLEVELDAWLDILDAYLNPFYQAITADNLNILQSTADGGAVSTTGEVVPVTSFLDFNQYMRDLQNAAENNE